MITGQDDPRASDCVLHEGDVVTAVGRVAATDDGGLGLWVRPAWDNPRLHQLSGGAVPLIVEHPPGLPEDQLVDVLGTWT